MSLCLRVTIKLTHGRSNMSLHLRVTINLTHGRSNVITSKSHNKDDTWKK
jgi:hypothetical protein